MAKATIVDDCIKYGFKAVDTKASRVKSACPDRPALAGVTYLFVVDKIQ